MPYPNIQEAAPDFTCVALMPDKSFKDISLSDYKGTNISLFLTIFLFILLRKYMR
jgi:hypothetical protein